MTFMNPRPAGHSCWQSHQKASYCSNMEVVSFIPGCSSWLRVSLKGLTGTSLPCWASLQTGTTMPYL